MEVAIEPIGKVESLICAVLRREAIPWPDPDDSAEIARFLKLARYHGTLPLLGEYLSGLEGGVTRPPEILNACHDEPITQAMCDLARRAELSHALARFASVGIRPLLLKGSALAYSHYDSPARRPRGDTDLVILPSWRKTAAEVLAELGYTGGEGLTAEFFPNQAMWSRRDSLGFVHDLDLH